MAQANYITIRNQKPAIIIPKEEPIGVGAPLSIFTDLLL